MSHQVSAWGSADGLKAVAVLDAADLLADAESVNEMMCAARDTLPPHLRECCDPIRERTKILHYRDAARVFLTTGECTITLKAGWTCVERCEWTVSHEFDYDAALVAAVLAVQSA